MNCPLLRKVLVVFPCAYGQVGWRDCAGNGAAVAMLSPGAPHLALQALQVTGCTHPPHLTSCQGKLDFSLRHKRSHDSPSAMCTELLGNEAELGNSGCCSQPVSPGHCPGCADAPGGLSAFPHLCPPQGAGLALSLQGKVGCILSLGHEPQSQHFGAGFPPLTPTYCMT